MALSKPLLSRLLPLPFRIRPHLRLLYLSTPTPTPTNHEQVPADAAAERRRRKRRLRVEPPLSRGPAPQRAPGAPRPSASNPNAPKLPEPASVLTGKRLDLHRRILALVRENDLDEAALLTRHSIYSNCRPTVFTCNAVLASLLRQARYADLLSLHRFVTQASVAPTVATYNLLLQAYCDCRRPDVALEHFRLLLKDDSPVLPSPTTYRILTRSLAENGKLDQALELKDGMLERGLVAPDPQVYAFIMGGFVDAGDGDKAVSLYEELKEKLGGGPVLDGVVYGNLMKGYFLKGMEAAAMDCYAEVLGEGSKVRFGAVSYNMVLDALGRNGRLEDALRLFDRMCSEHDPPRRIAVNLGSFNVMVDAYCCAERFQDAVEVFGKMAEKRCGPDALSYNNLIDWLGKNELVREAEGLYKEMGECGVKPDEYTYVLLIESCFKVDRVDDAVGYFNKMFDAGLRPNANAFNKIIGGLMKVDRLDEAQGFFDMMPEKEVKPNIASYELLLRAYIDAARLDDAIKMAKGILLDESVMFSDEMKALLEGALEKEGRDGDMTKLHEDVEREKAEAAARAAEEKARAEALAKEEEERKKAEAKAKEEAAARASRAAIEAVLGRKREAERDESADGANVEEAQVVETTNDTTGVAGAQKDDDELKKQESDEASTEVVAS
ncbi:pentatricopeptide repeat-containing protein At3g49240, mitochondrial-like [Phragmites australis]|uniref:pentatricopeptide repeat-containing protein At3g49240, mitochondrial-like n=1 Tax=Phragmites australis TaxID=29695 RepID=UPI002D77E1E1|nr:pentatricopeptide repeat-containing protein At3g49240, mitochondrial-like [Phragmites australis]